MNAAGDRSYSQSQIRRFSAASSSDLGSTSRKRVKFDERNVYHDTSYSASWRRFESHKNRRESTSKATRPLLPEVDYGKYGSATSDIRELLMRRKLLMSDYYMVDPTLVEDAFEWISDLSNTNSDLSNAIVLAPVHLDAPVVILDSDEDEESNDMKCESITLPRQEVSLIKPSGTLLMKDYVEKNFGHNTPRVQNSSRKPRKERNSIESQSPGVGDTSVASENESQKDKGEYIGTDDDTQMEDSGEQSDTCSDGLGDIWNEMTVAFECGKDDGEIPFHNESEAWNEEDCEHSFILKDDIGDVCRICGIIKRRIETIIDYNLSKGTKSSRTYRYESRSSKEFDPSDIFPDGFHPSNPDFTLGEIFPHPRHKREMKAHQVEGFNFLVSNLVSENPGGCIMAHAPGSGKTFMIISFLQGFMAKYPQARPLVILPKGILAIWKKEFDRWQVEDLPLYDFYSVKAENRVEQLVVLKKWSDERSVLFLGYKQFSTIVCNSDSSEAAEKCRQILLICPSILILDEGHTPRNEDTDVLTALNRVQTPRKVVLSGTLYQNHVKEVFNILNLVRPKFLRLEVPKAIKRRILSRAEISKRRNSIQTDNGNEFFELIEHTLLKDENHTRKVTVIQDLREMTKRVLHYYKGDNLDELPGLVDFSVFLQLTRKQENEVKELKKVSGKFAVNAQGSAIYVHPKLKALSKNSGVRERVDEEKIDGILENLDIREGVKGSFYLNLLQLCESSGEKLLVFSQYLLPLKFLERLTAKVKGYSVGREMFMITGDSDSETRESYMEKFNTSSEARVFFGSIKACGEGISLVGASRIIILDVHLNPSVTRQAIGRAFRPGQVRKVYVYRLICSDSPEEYDHTTCFKKELIAKMWFEWDEFNGHRSLEMETVTVGECGDMFLETERLHKDVVKVFRR